MTPDEIRAFASECRSLLWTLTVGHAIVTGTLLGILWGAVRW